MKLDRALIAIALLGFAANGWSQGWSPKRNVEIVVGTSPGGAPDKTLFIWVRTTPSICPHEIYLQI